MPDPTSLQERLVIADLAAAGCSDPQIAAALGRAPMTIRKWRRRAQQGRALLLSRRGRPATPALASFPAAVTDAVLAMRRAHPGWGPKTLATELAADPGLTGQALPSPASIARFLKAQHLVPPSAHHTTLPAPRPPPLPLGPHQVWEMDARGTQYIRRLGHVMLINLNDRASRLRLGSYPYLAGGRRATHHPSTADYQRVLRQAFSEWGLPDALAVDRESVFYDNASPSPWPTRWHLWLVALDVQVLFGPPGVPTERGITERSHQLWYAQVLEGQDFATLEELAAALTARRTFLNEQLPCRSLGEVPPLVAYPQAHTPRRPYSPLAEAELVDVARVYHYLSAGRWVRRVSGSGTISLGGTVCSVGRRWANTEVELRVEADTQQLVIYTSAQECIQRRAVPGLEASTLLGGSAPVDDLLGWQLPLPGIEQR
jgi:hypothetical protein